MKLTEIVIPTVKNVNDIVVFSGKKYRVVEKLETVKINPLLQYALGEEISDY